MTQKGHSQKSILVSPLVPPGYKQTEVGVIPEDWEVLKLSDHFNIYAGGDVPKDSLSQIQSEKYPFPIYANAIQNQGFYGFTSYKRSKSDSLTITARGYLGHAEYREEPFFPIVRLLVLEPVGSLDAKYTTYTVNERIKFPIESTGVPQLTAPQVGKYPVAAPPTIEEQRAIAAALSDVDALIDGLDRLIAKKRDLKQAAMQQLLTGQTRLPGFKGEWVYRGLPEVLVQGDGIKIGPFGSQLKKEHLIQNGPYRVYGQENVYQKEFSFGTRYLTREKFEKLKSCEIKPGDFVISTMGTIGKCAIVPPDICVGIMDSHLIRLRIDQSKILPLYLLHLFSDDFHYLNNQTSKLSVGGIMDGLSTKIVCALEIEYPESPEEQTAIATVLSMASTSSTST